MKLDVAALLNKDAQRLAGSEQFDFSGEDFYGYRVLKPVLFNWSALPGQGSVCLNTELVARLAAECARCTAPFETDWENRQEYRLRPADWGEDVPELPFSADGVLDLRELARQELVLEVGPVLLCREDCPGLCGRCGKPADRCRCAQEPEGDPRLQVLRDLLTQDDDD